MTLPLIPSSYKQVEEHIYSGFEHDNHAPYDSKAKLYERVVRSSIYNKLMWGTTPSDYIRFAKEALDSCTGTILDVGCGGLSHTGKLYAHSTKQLILLDYSIEMLRLGKARILKHHNPFPENIHMLHADAFNLPFAKESLDNVVSFGVMHLFSRKAEYVTNLLDVLKTGGRFYFTTHTTDRRLSRRYIEHLQKQHEISNALSSAENLAFFTGKATELHQRMVGNMVFVWGVK